MSQVDGENAGDLKNHPLEAISEKESRLLASRNAWAQRAAELEGERDAAIQLVAELKEAMDDVAQHLLKAKLHMAAAIAEEKAKDVAKAKEPKAERDAAIARAEKAEMHAAKLGAGKLKAEDQRDVALDEVERVRAEEREACAKVADIEAELLQGGTFLCPPDERLRRTAQRIAAAIRARKDGGT